MMNLTTPPFEKHIVRGPMDLYVQRRTTPSSGGRGLDTTLVHSVHGESKENGVSRSGWVAINAKARGEGEGGYYEDGDGDEDEDEDEGGYDMDIDFDNPSANEDEYPSEDFEEEIRYYTHQNDSLAHPTTNAPPEEKEEEGEEEELDGHPHHILKIYGSHDHIILTASKTSPLLTPHERTLLTQIKSRKDEATLGFPSGSHSYHAYLGPSILRNATLERLGLFLNGPELEKIKIGVAGYPNRKDWKRIKARTLWRTLYVRAIREREIDTILRDVEKQEKEREEVRVDGERSIGVKSSLFAAYNVQSVEGEEEISWDDLLKAELEMKTDGMSPGERREWLSGVYGARWTWAITEITTEQRLESLSDENNLKVHFTQGKFAEGVVQLGLESRADAMGLLGNGNFTWKNTRCGLASIRTETTTNPTVKDSWLPISIELMCPQKPKILRIVRKNIHGSKRLHKELCTDAIKPDLILVQHVGSNFRTMRVPDYELLVWPEASRVCFYVRQGVNVNSLKLIQHDGYFATLVFHTLQLGLVHLHNVYNATIGNINFEHLHDKLSNKSVEHILIRDFNLHHRKWGGKKESEDQSLRR
ncbi:hypothetical protein EG327_003971 [Venturia inaequalis]|uniref:Uncharacterized protein n=1 Tax=Venturia inaequalis TaxID=5025 RepID=A0A8H3VC78_VENIN|nr:hypothetical protein EG327_003971 [Venturia inaequalis]